MKWTNFGWRIISLFQQRYNFLAYLQGWKPLNILLMKNKSLSMSFSKVRFHNIIILRIQWRKKFIQFSPLLLILGSGESLRNCYTFKPNALKKSFSFQDPCFYTNFTQIPDNHRIVRKASRLYFLQYLKIFNLKVSLIKFDHCVFKQQNNLKFSKRNLRLLKKLML